MSIIKILDKEVYNKIAAGEVVERPASIVKELIENSIDAGATMISVDIEEGGIKRITVSDNGSGMSPDDLKAAFLPHATSKLTAAEDLFNLFTLGFRGEALPSIAAVSNITAYSRHEKNGIGAKYSINGGISECIEEFSCPNGTNITVKELFCNVPARSKFLKTARGEAAEITATVSKLILSNPMISIRYTSNGRTVFHSAGQGLKSALFTVYGADAAASVLPVNSEHNGIRIGGFIGKPDFSKSNRTYGTLIVNGRCVVNFPIAKVIADCYEGYLMKQQFPFYILNIDLDRAAVDVNVHPNKLEVRFSDFNALRGALTRAVSDALYGDRNAIEIREARNNKAQSIIKNKDFNNTYIGKTADVSVSDNSPPAKNDNAAIYEYYSDVKGSGFLREDTGLLDKLFRDKEVKKEEVIIEQGQIQSGANEIKIAGALFNTYIFAEYGDVLFIIDQHAAHERILYDKFMREAEGRALAVQRLLVPYSFRANAAECVFIEENADIFTALGFETSRAGTESFRIDSVPAALSDIELKIFIDTLLADFNPSRLKADNILREKIIKTACRAAVKGGDRLSNSEARELLHLIIETNCELRCPHGRPIAVKIAKSEIEKWFKRRS